MALIPCRIKLPALGRESYWERYSKLVISSGGPWKGTDPPCMGVCEKYSGGSKNVFHGSPGTLTGLLTHLPDSPSLGVSSYIGHHERGQGQRGPGLFCSLQEVCCLFCLYQEPTLHWIHFAGVLAFGAAPSRQPPLRISLDPAPHSWKVIPITEQQLWRGRKPLLAEGMASYGFLPTINEFFHSEKLLMKVNETLFSWRPSQNFMLLSASGD